MASEFFWARAYVPADFPKTAREITEEYILGLIQRASKTQLFEAVAFTREEMIGDIRDEHAETHGEDAEELTDAQVAEKLVGVFAAQAYQDLTGNPHAWDLAEERDGSLFLITGGESNGDPPSECYDTIVILAELELDKLGG